jgi:hypothetical protein
MYMYKILRTHENVTDLIEVVAHKSTDHKNQTQGSVRRYDRYFFFLVII